MKLYVGIDLHSTNSVVVVQDDEDRVVMQKRLPNDLRTITAWLEPYRDAIAGVAVESTYNWYWLATLLRLGLLPEGYIHPKEERPVRDLVRKRSQLVRQCTRHILSVENLIVRNTGRRISANAVRRLTAKDVEALLPEPDLALAIMLETGDIKRFAGVGNYVSYCRCVRFYQRKAAGLTALSPTTGPRTWYFRHRCTWKPSCVRWSRHQAGRSRASLGRRSRSTRRSMACR